MLLNSLLGPAKLSRVGPSWSLLDPPSWFSGGRQSSAGVTVTDDKAMSLSAVFAALRFLSQVVGMLPCKTYREQSDGGKRPATTHPAYRVLATSPNPAMTPTVYKQAMEFNRWMGSKACAEIQWNMGGNVAAVWPLEYWRVEVKADDGFYFIVDGQRRVEPKDMIYVPLFTKDGLCPKPFLDYAVESLGLGITQQQAAALFFGNGSKPSGFLKHPSNPPADQRTEFRRTWNETHGGPANVGKVGVVYGGWDYVPDSSAVSPINAQMLESRRFIVEEVARWFNIPPHLLRDLSRATYSNIEEQGIDFVRYTLLPILVSYEEEQNRKLLDPPNLYCKFNANALMRGNAESRSNFYTRMAGIGAMTINKILESEEENPIGPDGDARFVPVNMQTLERAIRPPVPPAPPPAMGPASGDPAPAPADPKSKAGLQGMVAATMLRMMHKEANAAKRAAANPKTFDAWMDDFYPKHESQLAEALAPASTQGHATRWAKWHVGVSQKTWGNFLDTMTPAQFPALVASNIEFWTPALAEEMAADYSEGFPDADAD